MVDLQMKITWREVRELEDFIQQVEDGTETRYAIKNGNADPDIAPWAFFADRPHLLLPIGHSLGSTGLPRAPLTRVNLSTGTRMVAGGGWSWRHLTGRTTSSFTQNQRGHARLETWPTKRTRKL